MKLLEVIRARRSIRRYNKKLPSQAIPESILEAGRWALSGLNNQPWRFLIIKDKTNRENLGKFTKYGGIIKDAPLV